MNIKASCSEIQNIPIGVFSTTGFVLGVIKISCHEKQVMFSDVGHWFCVEYDQNQPTSAGHQMDREVGQLWKQCDTEALLSGIAAWSENPCVLV